MTAPKNISQDTLDAIEEWAGYYRHNPHRFAKDYLHLDLRLFQKLLLVMMNDATSFVCIAARGIGKTFLCAVFCCIRCILYPGTKIVIASQTRGQSINVLEKIQMELRPRSPELAMEIDDRQSRMNGTNAILAFKNGSYIKVVTASDTARGNRANILLVDEFRLVPKDTVDTVLKNFLTNPRMPEYADLSRAERARAYDKERNKSLFASSAFYSDNWSYAKCKDTFNMMMAEGHTDYVCGFPYQLSLKEGLLRREDVEDRLMESDFSNVKFSMEMCAEFFGANEDAFFEFDSISKNRKIKYPMLPPEISMKLNHNPNVKIPHKQVGEIRILSADIALMSSRRNKNDATAVFVNQMMPTKAGRYINNIVYADAYEGLHTEDQALVIRKLFDDYQCDYLVLDTAGVGLGLYDCLVRDVVDSETGEIYPAISCCNNTEMAARCTSPNAEKVIWAIKASAQFNSDCAFLLREAFRSGRIRLLVTENEGDELLAELKGFGGLSPSDQMKIRLPYIHTTLLIEELTQLQHDESSGKVRIYEKPGLRKDRYSSLSYNYYVATQLETRARKKKSSSLENSSFIIKPPASSERKAVTRTYGHERLPW